ncbi:MAG: hypothetical protein RLZZ76_626 [Candidatus Parcubacteria bacterium]|jgi:UDP-N-acetylglucosamine 2-epimerase (non-hydrolysing)
MKKKIAICIGTRPEAIKLAPVILKCKEESNFEVFVCVTGQHASMVTDVLDFFNIVPDINFEALGKTKNLNSLLGFLIEKFDAYFEEIKPDVVLAQGDTTSALAAALASYYRKIKFGHVEAGLRTGDIYSPWPEEGNRLLMSKIATYHFAPTESNRANLLSENIAEDKIFVTGNTVVDALFWADNDSRPIENQDAYLFTPSGIIEDSSRIVLVTGHRRENLGTAFEGILNAILDLAKKHTDVHFVFPVHLNLEVRKQVDSILRSELQPNLLLIEPLSYPHMISLLKRCFFVLTDSGGIQEEAPSFKKPILVTRMNTERPEGVSIGAVKVIGTERESVFNHCDVLLTDTSAYEAMIASENPYGDGEAAARIVKILNENI